MKIYFSLMITFLLPISQAASLVKRKCLTKNTTPYNPDDPTNNQSGNTTGSTDPAQQITLQSGIVPSDTITITSEQQVNSQSGNLPTDYQPSNSPITMNEEMARLYEKAADRSAFMDGCNKLFGDYVTQATNTCELFYDGYVPSEPEQEESQVSPDDFIASYSKIQPNAEQIAFFEALNALKTPGVSESTFVPACEQELAGIIGMGLSDSERTWYCQTYYNYGSDWQGDYFYPVEIGDLVWSNPLVFMEKCMAKTYYSPQMCAIMWGATQF